MLIKLLQIINVKAIDELTWCLTEIPHARFHTNACESGWGAPDGNNPAGGKWLEEKGNNINYLELKN